jgi:hypothetical protein
VPPQFDGEICKIGITGYEDNEIRPHLDGKFDCIDRHHHVNVRLVVPFFGGRPIFRHDHESIRAQPVDELVFLITLVLPCRGRRWQPGINTISIKSRPVAGPARKSRNLIQSRPRPAVLTELPTFDSSTRTSTLARCEPSEFFFGIGRMNYVHAIVARTTFRNPLQSRPLRISRPANALQHLFCFARSASRARVIRSRRPPSSTNAFSSLRMSWSSR